MLMGTGMFLPGSGRGLVAQTTKQWTVDRFDALERGTADHVAIRSDGRLEAGPAATPVATLAAAYVWSIASDPAGTVSYAGVGGSTGGSAAVVRVGADGRQQTIFTGKELGVQALRSAADGALFAATSPDGKVYRLGATDGAERVLFDPAQTAEKPKYLWDLAIAPDGAVYVATGAPAAVFRVPAGGGTAELLFHTADQHIRSLLLAPDGTLWAGSDGAGVIYRFDTRHAAAKPFAAYAAARREITALALDAQGSLFAAAVGAKSPGSLPPIPVTGTVGITVTFVQPGSTSAAGSSGIVPEGSEIDRLAPDGTPERLLALPNDVVYGLTVRQGKLLVATGNRGRVYRVDPAVPGRVTETARLEAGQATAMIGTPRGTLIGTSNSGRIIRLSDAPDATSTYTSEVFDSGQFSRWGRVSAEADAPGFTLSARTGNVPSAVEAWSDWVPVAPDGTANGLPAGRYAQWRASMRPGGELDAVTMNYLPRNLAPVVDDLVVAPGARVQPTPANTQPSTVQVLFPNAGSAAQAIAVLQADTGSSPLTAQKDRNAVTVRWAAHDDNGDDLLFSVWYRGLGEANWRLLKDNLSERFFSFDASLLPDGRYEVRVIASDAPTHIDADTLTGQRSSAAFLIDTTPPVPGPLAARLENGKVHWTLDAHDAVSPIAHAEYALDGGPWQFVDPVGGLSDAQNERYDATVDLPPASLGRLPGLTEPNEHVLAVRVYDRSENMATVKTVVRERP